MRFHDAYWGGSENAQRHCLHWWFYIYSNWNLNQYQRPQFSLAKPNWNVIWTNLGGTPLLGDTIPNRGVVSTEIHTTTPGHPPAHVNHTNPYPRINYIIHVARIKMWSFFGDIYQHPTWLLFNTLFNLLALSWRKALSVSKILAHNFFFPLGWMWMCASGWQSRHVA